MYGGSQSVTGGRVVAVYCSVLQCVVVCCRCCSVLQYLQYGVVCCSVHRGRDNVC